MLQQVAYDQVNVVVMAQVVATAVPFSTGNFVAVRVGAGFAFTNSGTATSNDNLTRSADGRYLVLTGYDATPWHFRYRHAHQRRLQRHQLTLGGQILAAEQALDLAAELLAGQLG